MTEVLKMSIESYIDSQTPDEKIAEGLNLLKATNHPDTLKVIMSYLGSPTSWGTFDDSFDFPKSIEVAIESLKHLPGGRQFYLKIENYAETSGSDEFRYFLDSLGSKKPWRRFSYDFDNIFIGNRVRPSFEKSITPLLNEKVVTAPRETLIFLLQINIDAIRRDISDANSPLLFLAMKYIKKIFQKYNVDPENVYYYFHSAIYGWTFYDDIRTYSKATIEQLEREFEIELE